ncbi:Inositol-1,4,5-trisphosphate 5-phosphatase 1 [Exophiala dermatitidis]|uniref:phosphoinositide 5-phosphatase n=2 Tax=Exophiala dermatitidis TaxID=5970 RepID=H6BLM4_EXODN|nr:inositol-1,4,5-trisphosphate 5-phosphatase [Exophiala dermatitidis NIH/UT8656]KAJ4514592.1 Inositol-1,4,5-trisphosphate 5-phosphatase 1 [Exophiala dermatitidis]EHY51917.1 inositol-1,4,5-trisphosphate 5-phosphatase [Exophiala dermatitidis NIH/UT8656]KAJ4518023.1 Inositol-1,4,5-trisphosphate 5-phosphatase 1 [Exophiala dermatitidis]KAJ4520922.1 Inositol-1,4,5-trisphosphate 5-phosphatase 1 [Exophiala dermatitidis]KAJ4546058.1 Inositol-1,4,5-trisphosphate 5-phosphatase 1 [Exophiala dermatitidis]
MPTRVLIHDYPHRTLALATDEHVLVFRHTHSPPPEGSKISSTTSLPSENLNRSNLTPRCMVEFGERSSIDLTLFHSVAAAKGTLGLITLNNDVFLCVITGSEIVATVRPGELVHKIFAVEFYCLNRADYDHAYGPYPNPYPGQTFQSDDVDYGGGYDQSDSSAEHPFHALKKLLSNGHFYYSVDFDLTRRLQDRAEEFSTVDISSLDEGLLWNSYMIDPLLKFRSRLTDHERNELDRSRLLTSVIRGFVQTLTVPPSSSPIRGTTPGLPTTLTVISRLSSRRAGTRFNSRGIDDDGNVANFVETETVFWSNTGLCFSYVQIRGSIPIFWESSSSLIPGQQKIQITRSPEATQPSFDKHFANLERTYGAVHIVNLLSAFKPGEVELTERYRYHVARSPLRRHEEGEMEEHHLLRETEFDFHEKTKGASGYEGARAIRPYLEPSLESFVYFLSEDISEETVIDGKKTRVKRPVVVMQQNGVFRVNCLDCLDRTNLIQGMISQMALELFLSHRDERGNSDFWMRHSTLWADNGDALSKIYAGTGALKSSFTRHGKMSLAGAIADARKSATRLYVNHFEDKNKQNTVDLLLGRLVGQNSVDLYDPVNDWVVAEVARRRAEFETRDQINLGMGTYNLNGKTMGANEDLSPWLDVRGKDLDIVVVGFQELVELSPQQIMSTDPKRRVLWETAVRNCLNGYGQEKSDGLPGNEDEYVLLRSGQLVGAALMVFVRSSLLGRIKNVEGAIKKTGMSGIAGNKGAVAIRMDIESTSVCFVTAHLAAGFANYEERNRDYNTITSGLRFQRNRSIEDHEIIVWAGDFNYRIGLGYEKVRALVSQAMTGPEKVREEALGKLYENDQLNIQMVVGNCFNYYREGRVKFLPTYKYDIGTDDFDSSDKQRIPAWTDRIVWKINHRSTAVQAGEILGTQMKQLEYNSVMALRFSDHKPVYATFEMGILVVDEEKKEALTKKMYAKRAKEMKVHAGDSTEGFEEISSEGEEDENESVVGYESIQEGLPPASSDRRKWWLDGNKAARSTVRPPKEGMMLNKNREGNPWRESTEDEWVQVERPLGVDSNGGGAGSNANFNSAAGSRASSRKPDPPPSRGTRRMVPPPWEGERQVSSSTIPKSNNTSLQAPAPPTPRRVSAASGISTTTTTTANSNTTVSSSSTIQPVTSRGPGSQSASPQVSSSRALSTTPPTMAMAMAKKLPPPKPAKPSNLTSPSPTPTPTHTEIHPPRTSPTEDQQPPPLPKRTGTTSSTSSFVSARDSVSSEPAGAHKGTPTPPQPPPRGVSLLQQSQKQSQSQRPQTRDGGSGSSIGSVVQSQSPRISSAPSRQPHAESEVAPPLPPRRTNINSSALNDSNGGPDMSRMDSSRYTNGIGKEPTGDLLGTDDSDSDSAAGRRGLDKYKPLLPG